jgi:ribosome modulation factor
MQVEWFGGWRQMDGYEYFMEIERSKTWNGVAGDASETIGRTNPVKNADSNWLGEQWRSSMFGR